MKKSHRAMQICCLTLVGMSAMASQYELRNPTQDSGGASADVSGYHLGMVSFGQPLAATSLISSSNALSVGFAAVMSVPPGSDFDNDGVSRDGDGSGIAGDHPCVGGNTVLCDDNCPFVWNLAQTDVDSDGVGDSCDPDIDGDSLLNGADNCPVNYNPSQADTDGDGTANGCDPETFISSSMPPLSVPEYFQDLTVGNGGMITANASITVTGDMAVQPGGSVTHSGYPTNPGTGLVLNVTGDLTIAGSVHANEAGLRGGLRSGNPFVAGETFNSSNQVVASVPEDAGASYGGVGGRVSSSAVYGVLENPVQMGSGGGGFGGAGQGFGGNGGGLVQITAGNLILSGTVSANGGNNLTTNGGGGGSGGGIRITVSGNLSGAGFVRANGGNGSGYSGGGGGGRIAVFAGTNGLLLTNYEARGSAVGQNLATSRGSAGTIHLKDNAQANGDLIIDNGNVVSGVYTPLRTALASFRDMTIRNAGTLQVASSMSPHLFFRDVSVTGSNSFITTDVPDFGGVRMSLTGTLTLSSGAYISTYARGLRGAGHSGNLFGNAGEAYDPSDGSIEPGSTGGSGGSYGGLGGGATPNPVYGIPEKAVQAGSGGSRSAAAGLGGRAGGLIWIDAATCSLAASGTAVYSHAEAGTSGTGAQGGGSGGAIRLDCATVTGGAIFNATGGAGSGTNGNGGGGGRVGLRTNNNQLTSSFATLCNVAGGAATGAGQAGQAGTCFLGDLFAPTVTAMSPAPGSTAFGTVSQVTATFTENLYGPGITSNHVSLVGAATGAHTPSGVSFNTGNQTLTITFAPPLAQDSYTLTLVSGEELAGLSDGSLNALDGEYSGTLPSGNGVSGGNFVAGFAVNLPPVVVGVDPANNTLEVPEASNVTVTFSEPVSAATINNSTVRLLKAGVPVASTVTLSTSGLRATIDPASALLLNTLYQVEVTTGVQDVTGQAALPASSLFRTTTISSATRTLPSVSDEAGGLASLARTGHAVAAAGDLNGDGLKDFLAGSPAYQPPSGGVEAGAAVVYFGSIVSPERKSADIVFTGEGAHDRAGVSVSGRFDHNGDGRMDILIGAEQFNRTADDDPGAGCNAGAPCGAGKVYLIYFDPTDTTHYPNINDPNIPDVVSLALVGQPGGIPGVVFTGASLGDRAGLAVVGGGRIKQGGTRDDLALGSPGKDVTRTLTLKGSDPQTLTTFADAGAVYVIFSGQTLVSPVDLSLVANGQGNEIAGVVYEGEAVGDQLGFAVAFPGDVMGTVGDDLAMGAPTADPLDINTLLPLTDAGTAYVVQGGDLSTAVVNAAEIGFAVDGTQIRGTQAGMQTGFSVAGGGDNQVDGDLDLLVGSPLYDDDIRTDCGLVTDTARRIVRGTIGVDAVGTPKGNSCSVKGRNWRCEAAGDHLGHAVAGLGDVTGDGYDDIAMGAPLTDPVVAGTPRTNAGTVYVVHGAPQSQTCGGAIPVSDIGLIISGEALVGTTVEEQAGSSIAGTGDLNGDGYDDFVVGALLKDVGGDPDAGTVYEVLDAHIDPAGPCGAAGCLAMDLGTGAAIQIAPGALTMDLSVFVTGVTTQASLPLVPPTGSALAGAADIIGSVPVVLVAGGNQVVVPLDARCGYTNDSAMRLWYYASGVWQDTGIDGLVTINPTYPLTRAVTAPLGAGRPLGLYAVFVPDTDMDMVADCRDNCGSTANPTQADFDTDGVGDLCDNCVFVANALQDNVDGDAIGDICDPCPFDAFNDGDGDGFCADLDNCPLGFNPSQADEDGNGVGDACDVTCALSVDVAGGADFTTIQGALDQLNSQGLARCHVTVADGTYYESLVVSAPVLLEAAGPGVPVVDATSLGAVVVSIGNQTLSQQVVLKGLELRGASAGVTTLRQVDLQDVAITGIPAGGAGLEVLGGTVTMRGGRIEVAAGAASRGVLVAGITTGSQASRAVLSSVPILVPGGIGVEVYAGKSAHLEGVEIRTAGTGLKTSGAVTVDSSLMVDGTTGIEVTAASGASVEARYVTVSNNTAGLLGNNATANSLRFEHGIAWGNTMDLSGLTTCAQVFASDVGTTDCTGGGNPNGNILVDPQFVDATNADPMLRDYRTQSTSPVPDQAMSGELPMNYTGAPCRDITGTPRLKDANGDGLVVGDLGAYEMPRWAAGPGEVSGFELTNATTMIWDVEPSAATYNIYRGTGGPAGTALGYCLGMTPLQAGTAATTLTDNDIPPAGSFFYYVAQAVDSLGRAGTLGAGSCAERTLASVCGVP